MLSTALDKAGYEVKQARHHGEALTMLGHDKYELVILDLRLEGSLKQTRFEGEDLLETLNDKGLFSIIVTSFTTPETDRRLVDRYGRYGMFRIVDKLRFSEEGYLDREFLVLVAEALHEADQADQANGLTDEQLNRLEENTL